MFGFGENVIKFGTVARGIILLAICLSTSAITFTQPLSLKGQLWGNILHGNDPPAGHSSFVTDLGYIPMLSLSRDLSINRFVDLEWSYRMQYRLYDEDVVFSSKPYRLWLR